MTRLATPIFDQVHQQMFWPSFNLCEFMSTCKKSGYSIDLFWRYVWLKTHAIWLAENILANISGTKNFPNIGFVLSILNNTNFHYRTNSAKINDHIFQQIQKTLCLARFWSIFLIFGAKNFFSENSALSCTTSNGFLAPCQKFEENAGTDRRTEGRTNPI